MSELDRVQKPSTFYNQTALVAKGDETEVILFSDFSKDYQKYPNSCYTLLDTRIPENY